MLARLSRQLLLHRPLGQYWFPSCTATDLDACTDQQRRRTMTAIWNLTKRKGAYAFAATAALVFVSLSLAQRGNRTRFVYLISGQVAAGLKVTVVSHDGKTSNYTTDANGYVNGMPKEGKLIIADPVTGLKLIDQMLDKYVTEFKVPLPIRVRGTVYGFGRDPAS